MDGLLVLLGLAVLAIPVAVVALLIGQSRLKSRVRALEMQVAALTEAKPVAAPANVGIVEKAAELVAVLEAAPPPAPSAAEHVAASTLMPGPAEDAPLAAIEASEQEPTPVPPAPVPQDVPIVMRADRASALGGWLQRNWIYVVSAASLALAGVFLVQYSVQSGLLPPAARVIGAYLFGAALVAAGEWMRRHRGDGEGSDTAYLPSVFAGAGLVTLFAATLAARQLYGLIGPEAAFALYVLTAAAATVLGWFYGPLLVSVGLIGAALAPFLVGSDAAPTSLLYLYFGLITATGLAVDAMRRWAWVSVLALVLGYVGGLLMLQGGAGQASWLAYLLALPALAIALPPLRLIPDHAGPSTLQAILAQGKTGWPIFPTRLVAGTTLVSTLGLMLLPGQDALTSLTAFAALTLFAVALLIWAERAEGLADLALLPAVALVLRLLMEATHNWPLSDDFASQAIALRPPESTAPLTVTWLVIMAALISGAFTLRALRGGPLSLVHGLAAVLVAPVAVAVLELIWQPALVIGLWPWALHAMVLAAAMVALAERFAKADGPDHRRMAYATLSALSLIALSLFLLTSATALTLALGVLAVAAAWLDRRFALREMGLFIQVAVAVLGYRLLVDPGLDWAMVAPLGQMLLAFGGVIAAEVAGYWLLGDLQRPITRGVLESAALALVAVLADVLLSRWVVPDSGAGLFAALDYNYLASLKALPWLALMLAQVYRAGLGGALKRLRQVIAAVAGVLAAIGLLVAAVPLNPLFASYEDGLGAKVIGPAILDTLALSYAMPGLILVFAGWRLGFGRILTIALLSVGSALMALYAALEIRRFWQGDWLGRPGVTQYELYSYTIALMLIGAALLYQAIARRSTTLRRIAMAVIAVTVAKVFLIDAAGLTGLTRVFSFFGLGLSLAGLAWLNRWAGKVSAE